MDARRRRASAPLLPHHRRRTPRVTRAALRVAAVRDRPRPRRPDRIRMRDDLRPWTELVRRPAPAPGITLPVDVLEELALHLLETYASALRDSHGESEARDRAQQELEAATMSDLARHARRSSGIRPPSEDGEGKGTPLFGLWLDLRHASRLIRRSPAFSAAIVGVLAFGNR